MRGITCLLFVAALSACGDDPSTEIACGEGIEASLSAGGTIEVTADAGKDLRGAAIAAPTGATPPTAAASIKCAADIVPAGYTALGPAVTFGPDGAWSEERPFAITLPYKAARLPKNAERRHVRIVAKRDGQSEPFFPMVSNRVLEDEDRYASRAAFRAGELTTYQVVAAENAGEPETRQFGWRAIVGISMGGNAAMSIGLRHPDKFDIVADLGGEPGPSMIYSLRMVSDFLFGGFCTVEDQLAGRGNVGTLCPKQSAIPGQFEITADYEHQITQTGDGVGLTLRRGLYMRASRDLGRALSNPALYNPSHPYAPPGVDPDFFQVAAATRCANPIVLKDFYDSEFNPDGSKDVITFCDGNDGPTLGNGVFDPSIAATDPAELLLAVDLNANGKRDAGEPVVTNAYEPFKDVGTDGKADAEEAGYDAATNRDPARDNFHALRNPLGTEADSNWQQGEPYQDVGLDGIAATCQHGETPGGGIGGCYDFGEGNGKWDLSPNVQRWYESDLNVRLAALSDERRKHMSLWFDAGIRDFLNASVSANAAVGPALARYGLPFGVYDNFSILDGGPGESSYDFNEVQWPTFPKNGYLRYGNPDATAQQINSGDGRHVGTGSQIIYRAQTAFAWINQRWPDGDVEDTYGGGQVIKALSFTSPTTGRLNPYAIFLPPGYDKPENADRRYPVVYFLHGYGQEPDDLVALSSVFELYMIASQPIEKRFQKYIIVYVDGRCRPNLDGTPVDLSGDRCEGGTFYLDAPLGGLARMETNMLDLMDYVDATYRTKAPSAAQVVD
ncbi:MAG TPA: alpha/beta hydrolase-fold protein [Kofleriaceae bacterium]